MERGALAKVDYVGSFLLEGTDFQRLVSSDVCSKAMGLHVYIEISGVGQLCAVTLA